MSILTATPPSREQVGEWAWRGDILAHGGIASALDTQTALCGSAIRFDGRIPAQSLPCAPGLSLVIGQTGVVAATSEVNGRVRAWIAERPASRRPYLQAIGALTRAAERCLAAGDWPELGHLMNLNHAVLEKVGVSCLEIDRLVATALDAGAYGAKISGSGGGGIILALASPESRAEVARAIREAGGEALVPEIGVPGARIV